MRYGLFVLLAAVALCACGAREPFAYPAETKAVFHAQCPADHPACICTWDEITRALPAEDYDAVMDRFQREGLMDPRITRIRAKCREKHPD